jgi:hypothetical protein
MAALLSATWLCGTDDAMKAVGEDVGEHTGLVSKQVYKLTGGGEDMEALGKILTRLPEPEQYRPPTHLLLTRTATVTDALAVDAAVRAVDERLDAGAVPAIVERAIYVPVSFVSGPCEDGSDELAPAIQFGTFSMRSVPQEWDLAVWYETLRLPLIRAVGESVRATRYVSMCGCAKFGVLYEFLNLDARLAGFERPHEKLAMDMGHPTGRIVQNTVHSRMSPSIGYALSATHAAVSSSRTTG